MSPLPERRVVPRGAAAPPGSRVGPQPPAASESSAAAQSSIDLRSRVLSLGTSVPSRVSSIARTQRNVKQRARGPAWLMFGGAPVIVLVLSALHAWFVAVPRYNLSDSGLYGWIALYSLFVVVASYAVGLPDEPRTMLSAAGRALAAGALSAGAISLFGLLTASNILPRFTVLGTVVVLVPWAVFCNWAVGTSALRGSPIRVLVVASDAEVAGLRADMVSDLERPAQVVGHVALDQPDARGASAHTASPGSWAGSSRPATDAASPGAESQIVAQAKSTGAELVVVSSFGLASPGVVHEVAEVHEAGVRVRSLSDFYQDWMGKLPAGEVERSSLLFDIGEVHGRGYSRVKRLFDVVGAGLMMVPLAVLAPVVWLLNLVGNRGPLIYRQVRVGRNGEQFSMLKFRTMTPHSGGSQWTVEGDPRITPVGRWLRRSHLDELPQAVNVLRGELSLVGPRPEQPGYVADLSKRLPYYGLRHVVRPGLTGWAQVKYPYGASEEDAFEKLQFDFFYLRHQGLAMDLRCIARTLRTVTGATGR